MRNVIVVWILLAALTDSVLPQTTLVIDSAFAPSMDRTMKFAVLLPAGYSAAERYPVLYLLHGLWGTYTDYCV